METGLNVNRLHQFRQVLVIRIAGEELGEIDKGWPIFGSFLPAALHHGIDVSWTEIGLRQAFATVHQLDGIDIRYFPYGGAPRENISQMVTPKDHTSLACEKMPRLKLSGAYQRMGQRPPWVNWYSVLPGLNDRDMPKSLIFAWWRAVSNIFLAARSRCTKCCDSR